MIYIAGKITGLPTDLVDAKFQEAENRLHALGLKVINPTKLGISDSWTWDEQMALCLKVINERATAIFLLDDWQDSNGARREFLEVTRINNRRKFPDRMQIYFEDFDGYSEIEMDAENGFINCLIPHEDEKLN
jgi:hypothetical protein